MSGNEFNFLPRFEAYKPSKFLKDFYPFCSVVSVLRYLFFFLPLFLPGYSPQPPPQTQTWFANIHYSGPITETIQRGSSRFRLAPMSRHCGTPFDVVTYLGYYVIFIKITHHRAESIITLSFHKRIRVLQW